MNKKTVVNALLLASFTPFLVQCAAQSDVDELRYQLLNVNRKLDDMKTTTVDNLQKRQAAAYGQLDQMENDILELKSQLEESYHLNQRLREENKELQERINNVAQNEASKREEAMQQMQQSQTEKDAQLAAMNQKLQQQEANLRAIQQQRVKDAERRAKEAALAADIAKQKTRIAAVSGSSSGSTQHITKQNLKVKKGSTQPTYSSTPAKKSQLDSQQAVVERPPASVKTSEPAAPQPSSSKADGKMSKAQSLYDSNNYSEAYKQYEQIANSSSGGDSAEARFMMGECLFNQKDYDKAIMQYQKIISQYPDTSKAPKAMLKQAMSFEKLADKETAKVIYKKLAKKYPGSSEAAAAQEHLK